MLDQNKKDKRVEESMGQSDKMLRDMLEMANEGVLSTDPREGTIIYANPAAARIFGYDSPDELVGKSYVNFYAYPDQRAFILKRLEKTGSVTNFETTMIKKDGRKVDVLTTVAAQKDANGKIFRADGFFTDITERQHVQEEIARLGSAVDQSIDGIAISDTERYVVYANKAFADIHGYLPEEVIGKMRLRDFYPEEIPMYEAIKNKLASQGSGVIDEERIKKDGTVFPAFASFSRLTNEAGEPTGFVAVVKDITERKQAETEIAKLSSVVAQSIDGIAIADIDGLITYVNLAYAQMHGYTPQEMVGIRLRKLNKRVISGQFRTSTIGDILQQQDVSTLEVEHYRQDGSYFPALISLSFLRDEKGDPAGVASIANDITERKRVQEDVKRLGNAVEQSIDGIAMSDTGPRLTFVNQAFAQMHGYTVDEMLGMKVEGIHSKQQQKEFESRIGQIASEGYWAGEIGHMRKDGSTFPTFMTTTMLKDDDGNPTGIMVVTRDITETKRVEESVRESSERVVDLIASLHNAVFVYMAIDDGQNFVFTEFNYAAEEIEGFSRDEIIGKSVSEVSPRAKGSGLIKALQRVYKTGKPEHYPPSIYKNRGGGPDIWREVWLYKLNSGEVVAEYSDVTGLKSTEETLKQNEQRFRSVTETAADAIISIDSQGLITLWNNEAERMFGYERDEIIGKSVSAIMPQEFQDAHTKAVKRVVTTGKKKIMGQKVEI
ncbi:MAG: PAS domain S-box protein, partial [Chloroflexi bacterium]|nr:PAS domain S-box protein [Chloroflexota bacterium]